MIEALTVITQRQFMHPILAGRLASYRYTGHFQQTQRMEVNAFGPKINYTDLCNCCVSIFG